MAFVLESGTQIVGKLNKTTIEFRAERYFCALRPVSHRITFWTFKNGDLEAPAARLLGKGRAPCVELKSPGDAHEAPMDLVRQGASHGRPAPALLSSSPDVAFAR